MVIFFKKVISLFILELYRISRTASFHLDPVWTIFITHYHEYKYIEIQFCLKANTNLAYFGKNEEREHNNGNSVTLISPGAKGLKRRLNSSYSNA